ncbi:hypothetical protein ES708_27613 [subsurface metagenome]
MVKKRELKKLVGYCRVSTEIQKDEKTILVQEQNIREYAKKNNFELVKIFSDEAISGGSELENRPELSSLFNFVEDNKAIEAVIIYKLDRLARDLYIQEHLIRKFDLLQIKLISINEPDLSSNEPTRKAFRQFLGIIAELEKSYITMRLSSGRIFKAQKGGFAGGSTALGYITKNKKLFIDEEQAKITRMIFKMKRHKRMGLREIARELNKLNIPTSSGKGRWHARTVKYILENPIYKGIAHYKEIEVKNIDLALL